MCDVKQEEQNKFLFVINFTRYFFAHFPFSFWSSKLSPSRLLNVCFHCSAATQIRTPTFYTHTQAHSTHLRNNTYWRYKPRRTLTISTEFVVISLRAGLGEHLLLHSGFRESFPQRSSQSQWLTCFLDIQTLSLSLSTMRWNNFS